MIEIQKNTGKSNKTIKIIKEKVKILINNKYKSRTNKASSLTQNYNNKVKTH